MRDAIRLASILNKYVDVKRLSPDQDAIDFISGIVEKISPQDFILCVAMMKNITEEDVKKEISLDVLTAFIEGLKTNRVMTLLEFYKSLGF